jgi:PAS domain S-box-containing protein
MIGIGAGDGGLPALLAFLQNLPADSGLAFVLVAPQLLRQRKTHTALRTATALPLIEVTAPVALQPDQLYLAPAQGVEIAAGQLQPLRTEASSTRHPIDAFFSSLATTVGARAVAIVLAGKGRDGLAGLQAVRDQGGWTLAQTPEDAAQSALPQRAIQAGLVETIAPAGELAERVVNRLGQMSTDQARTLADAAETETLAAILEAVHAQTGYDFGGYQRYPIAPTDVGTIFLDRSLRIKRFTPRATDLFYLRATDLGRPFAHVTHRLRHGRLLEQLNHVLESQEAIEEIVQSKDDHWFMLRMMPYRTLADSIDGVALTFVDISDLKQAESELQQRIQQQAVADLGRQALAMRDLNELFTAATARIAEVLDTQFSKLLALQPDGRSFRLVAGAGWPAGSVGQVVVPNDRRLLAGFVLHTGEPLQIVDIRTEARFTLEDHLRNQQVISGMTVLVPGPHQPYGVLGVFSTTPRTFSHHEADFLQSVANLLGAAVARAGAEEQVHYQARLLDAVEQAVVAMDMQGKIVYWNRFAETLYGWRAEEVIGRPLTEVFIPPWLRQEARQIRQRIEQGQSWSGEFTLQRKDGSTFPASITDSPIYDEQGTQIGVVGVSFDITERKRAEQALRFLAEASTILASSLDYEDTLETVARLAVPQIADWCAIDLCADDGPIEAVAIAHVDPDKVAWAYELRRRYPIDPEATVGVAQVIRTGVADFYPVITDEMLAQAAQTPEELELLRKIGYRSLMTVPLQVRDHIFGAITFVATESNRYFTERDLAVAQDVARRAAVAIDNARLFRALQVNEERSQQQLAELQGVYASAPVGLAVLDPELRYVRVNETLARMNGLPAEEHIGKSVAELLPTLSRTMDDLAHRVLATGEPLINYESSSEVPAYPGQERSWLQSLYPLRAGDGRIVGLNAVVQDITDRKRQEAELKVLNETLERRVEERTAELERSNRELDQFAYVASHDLKAPLRGIGQLAAWIIEDAEPLLPEKSKEHLAKLQRRIRRMGNLLDDLLAYSRAGRVRHALEQVDVTALVRDLVETLSPPAGFDIRIQPEMPVLRTERVALELVLRNLIGNAIKHHDKSEGVIEITAQETEDWIEIAVSDNGPGIAPQYHERIFEMFQTLQPRDRVEGSGMGLAIVKRILEARGGSITLASAEGVGTTFRFTWPKRSDPPGEGQAIDSEKSSLQPN